MRHLFQWLCLGLLSAGVAGAQNPAPPELVSVKKIWSGAGHNAFTDLLRHKGEWFCVFREADGHVNGNGRIRVLVSPEGEQWQSAALLGEEGIDLRDPKLSVTPDNRLLLTLGGSVYRDRKLVERQPRSAFSPDGRQWTTPQRVGEKGDWLWRVTWHQGRAYGIVYTSPTLPPPGQKGPVDWGLRLVAGEDGLNFRTVTSLAVPAHPNEATLRFLPNGDAVALVRREGFSGTNAAGREAWIGRSSAPYRDWQWQSAGMQIGGPNFLILPEGGMIASGREYHPAPTGAKTFVGLMDRQSVTPQLTLPSGGDCSYPGLVWQDGLLWVSYYSSHEGKSSIYLAKLKLR